MFEWLLKKIISLVSNITDYITTLCLNTVDMDLTQFYALFPVADDLMQILKLVGVSFVFIQMIWQTFKVFGVPIGIEAENPLTVMCKSLISILLIFESKNICTLLIDLSKTPYELLGKVNATELTEADKMNEFIHTNFLGADGYNAGNFFTDGALAIGSVMSGTAIVSLLVALVVVILVVWYLFKLTVEVVERYVLLGCLAVTSPLGFMLFCCQDFSTSFKSWCRMFCGQIVMLLLNVWSLKMYTSLVFAADKQGSILLWLFTLIAFARIASRLDMYMQKLGIDVGTTGGTFMEESIVIATALGGGKGRLSGILGKGVGGAGKVQNAAGAGAFAGKVGQKAGFKNQGAMQGAAKGSEIGSRIGEKFGNGKLGTAAAAATTSLGGKIGGKVGAGVGTAKAAMTSMKSPFSSENIGANNQLRSAMNSVGGSKQNSFNNLDGKGMANLANASKNESAVLSMANGGQTFSAHSSANGQGGEALSHMKEAANTITGGAIRSSDLSKVNMGEGLVTCNFADGKTSYVVTDPSSTFRPPSGNWSKQIVQSSEGYQSVMYTGKASKGGK